jgi:hypothetical protein
MRHELSKNEKIAIAVAVSIIIFSSLMAVRQREAIRNGDSGVEHRITNLLAKKYDRQTDSLIVAVATSSDRFVKGTVNFLGENGGGIWFAVKTEKGWELAYDGNGIIPCAAADKYGFPKDMIPQCIDTEKGNELIQR